jgi:hypothetical protein
MSEMLFYEQVATLDANKHGHLKLKPLTNFGFASKINSVPLLATEFSDAAKEYPIAFAKSADDAYLPVALLGVRDAENLFVDAQEKWDARYLPAFIRRYPFVPAEIKDAGVVVCLDEKAACFDNSDGEALFVEGKPGLVVQNILRYLQDYQNQAARTAEFMKRLATLDLLVLRNAEITLANGQNFNLNGVYVIDEAKFQALDKDTVMKIFSTGELGLIYAHLMSLANLNRLLDRLSVRLSN